MYLLLRSSKKVLSYRADFHKTPNISSWKSVTPNFTAIEKQKCKARTETRLRPQGKFGFYCTTFHEMPITEQTSPITKEPNWTKNVERKTQGKVQPKTSDEVPDGENSGSSTLPLTSALDAGGCSTPHFSHFTPGKETRYPLCRRLGGPQGRSGRVRKISPHRDLIPGPSTP